MEFEILCIIVEGEEIVYLFICGIVGSINEMSLLVEILLYKYKLGLGLLFFLLIVLMVR